MHNIIQTTSEQYNSIEMLMLYISEELNKEWKSCTYALMRVWLKSEMMNVFGMIKQNKPCIKSAWVIELWMLINLHYVML